MKRDPPYPYTVSETGVVRVKASDVMKTDRFKQAMQHVAAIRRALEGTK